MVSRLKFVENSYQELINIADRIFNSIHWYTELNLNISVDQIAKIFQIT